MGAWREAFVDGQDDEHYLLRDSSGARRWAVAGEIAWHDVTPQPFDLHVGKSVIAWDGRDGLFQNATLIREEASRGNEGGVWAVRFDCGHEVSCQPHLR